MKIKIFLICFLLLSLTKLHAEKPDWEVKTGDYMYTMTLVCASEIDGKSIEHDNIVLAAFCNNVCRGTATPLYHPLFQKFVFFLSVMGNKESEPIHFRMWDGSTDKVYEVKDSTMYIMNDNRGYDTPVQTNAAYCRQDFLLSHFETDYQVMPTQIKGDSIIEVHHGNSINLSNVGVRFSSPAENFCLKLNGDTLKSEVSRINLYEENWLNLYTPDSLLVQRYKLQLVYAYPTRDKKLRQQNLRVYRDANDLYFRLDDGGQLLNYAIYSTNGMLIKSGSITGDKKRVALNGFHGHFLVKVRYLMNGKVQVVTRKVL